MIQIIEFLNNNKGYLKKHPRYLVEKFNISEQEARQLIHLAKKGFTPFGESNEAKLKPKINFQPNKNNIGNVLILGDLHAPFILDGYLEWCKQLERDYKINKVIFIGDIVDGHAWSYHESDVDGMSVGHELAAAIKQLQLAYKLFPNADVLLGNHDLLIARKAKTAGLSKHFIKDFKDVIQAPKGWNFLDSVTYDNVKYIHGSIGNAFKRATDSRISTVQGHLHSQAFVQYSVSEKDAIFGLQIGCGLDHDAYAFEYAKPLTKKPVISAGLVLENGTLPIIKLMPL